MVSEKEENAKKKPEIYPHLNKFELLFYVVTWLCLYFLAIKQVYPLSLENLPKSLRNGYLQVSRSWFTSKLIFDKSDYEWELWNHFFLETVVYAFTGHFIVMRICEKINSQYRFCASAIYTTFFCWHFFGLQAFLLLCAQSFIMLTVTYFTESVFLIWGSCIMLIVSMHTETSYEVVGKMLNDTDLLLVLFICSCSMCNLRYTSYCLEYCWKQTHEKQQQKKDKTKSKAGQQTSFFNMVVELFLYQLYFPLFVGGPIVTYNMFIQQKNADQVSTWTWKFCLKFVFGLLRYTFWHFFLNFILYYMHFSSIHYDTHILETVPLLTLCGLALCSVQFFCMKYMIMYGLPHHYATSDNLQVPAGSHCVSSKHRFTDMWKYFDRGLHKWLVRYIYIPLGGSNPDMNFLQKTINSLVPFAFVYVWHGTTQHYFIWAVLNWFGVYIEKVALDVYRSTTFQEFETKYFSPQWSRRLRAIISSLPFSLLIVSNIYFLSGVEVGNIYMKRIYTEDFWGFICIHFALVCGAQTSMELMRLGF
uniref:Protein-cysteine N-palmitoyltransferase HHAT-like n=1 Tax=Phallusia mammillata TaxID=59560 RepID=A0A6F9DEP8_9ASCI|nr:protein-cysteine N-palmitoyltransferase HHAT-like [Phallusia mammillata]